MNTRVRPWLLIALLCALSAGGAAGATRKLLEAKYATLAQAFGPCGMALGPTLKTHLALPSQEPLAGSHRASKAQALAEDSPAPPADDRPVLATMDAAALFALKTAYDKHPHWYEFGGVIVKQPNGTFSASTPITIGHADNMDINEDYEHYDGGFPIVADYHTHPCIDGYVPGVFSPADLHSSRESVHGGYILDECTGDVHYWAPGDPYTTEGLSVMEIARGVQIAAGKVVGHVDVDGKRIQL